MKFSLQQKYGTVSIRKHITGVNVQRHVYEGMFKDKDKDNIREK